MSQVISPPSPLPATENPAVAAEVRTPGLADILIVQDETAASQNAFDYALALSDAFESRLVGLMFGLYPPSAAMGSMEVAFTAWSMWRNEALEEARQEWKILQRRFEKAGAKAELRRVDAFSEQAGSILAQHGRYADLLVVGWPADDEREFAANLLERALFESGRPVLVVPHTSAPVGSPARIAIAWNGAREATRAVHDALPLLRRADAVALVVVDDQSALTANRDPGADIAGHLARHGVEVEVRQVPTLGRSAAAAVLDDARYFGADVIVAGGYGHSRLSEWAFGGFTREILASTTTPLLLSH